MLQTSQYAELHFNFPSCTSKAICGVMRVCPKHSPLIACFDSRFDAISHKTKFPFSKYTNIWKNCKIHEFGVLEKRYHNIKKSNPIYNCTGYFMATCFLDKKQKKNDFENICKYENGVIRECRQSPLLDPTQGYPTSWGSFCFLWSHCIHVTIYRDSY